jgi:hypothetical protein
MTIVHAGKGGFLEIFFFDKLKIVDVPFRGVRFGPRRSTQEIRAARELSFRRMAQVLVFPVNLAGPCRKFRPKLGKRI